MLRTEELVVKVDDEGGKKCLLDHISFEVKDGEMLVITGPNGGGKSTLAKTLIGINKPESGKIYLNDVDMILIIVQMQESVMHSSSHPDSRECRSRDFYHWQQEKSSQSRSAAECFLKSDFVQKSM